MGIFSKASVCNDRSKYANIETDFILNRFDLKSVKDFELLKWQKFNKEYYVQVSYENNVAVLGLYMARASGEIIRDISRYIFKNRKNVERIEYYLSLQKYSKHFKTNHYRIELPETSDELLSRTTQKSRYNLRRSFKKLQETYGETTFEEYDVKDAPTQIVEEFLKIKRATYDENLTLSAEEYVKHAGVSHVYTMNNSDGIVAIILSCEQCGIVYLENLAYNGKYGHFSPGQILYRHYLERLIEKKRKNLYLMGGDYEYKGRYGGIEDTVYNGIIYRGFKGNWKNYYKPTIVGAYKKLKHRIKVFITGK